MKHFLSIIFSISFISLIILITGGCANIIPPGGGPRDTLPPKLIAAVPKDSSLFFRSKTITLTFDEFVEVKDVQQNLIVSPYPKYNPIVDYKLKSVTIKLRDSLEPNTTYALKFGNSIKDINEGNVAKNFTYVFSTGNHIDDYSLSGKVVLAESGKVDTTLIVVLHKNLDDTSVVKNSPRYYTTIDNKGNFTFNNLPSNDFSIYVLPNDYTKKYDDSTKMFAFSNQSVNASKSAERINLYAYEEYKKTSKPAAGMQSINPRGGVKEDKKLRYSTNLEAAQQDILNDTLQFVFNKKLKKIDTSKIVLTDTNYKAVSNYHFAIDSSSTKIFLIKKWKEEQSYKLIVFKEVAADSNKVSLTKNDTLLFTTKRESDYGSLKIRFRNIELSKNPVVQIVEKDNIIRSFPLTQKELYQRLFKPGEYGIRILYDENKNGVWDKGNFVKKKQPEIVINLNKKITVQANFDREYDIVL